MNRGAIGAVAALVVFALTPAPAPAQAQDYPSRPIKFIVPTAPAGIGDILPRLFQLKLAESGSSVSIVIENRPGAAGVVGVTEVARAAPDGYTMLMGNHAVLAIRPHLGPVPYDAFKSFEPVALLVTVPNILVVHPSVPAKSVQELIAYAKANPGKLTYASQGVGSSGHIAGELFRMQAGIDIVHVPYKGAAPAAQDLAAGHVNMMFDAMSLALPSINGARVRALGVVAKQRVNVVPDVPTMAEQGMPIEAGAWFGMLAPAGTPKAAIAWVNREVNKVFAVQANSGRFVNQGAAMPLGTPEDFGKYILAESNRYGDIVRRAGIKLE